MTIAGLRRVGSAPVQSLNVMAQQSDPSDPSAERDDRETLLEIARLIDEADPESAASSDNGEMGSRPAADEPAATPPATAVEDHGPNSEADAPFEAHPEGLALCSAGMMIRANASFALAFGYPTARELIAAGGLEAIFPGEAEAFERPVQANGSAREQTLILDAVTRSGRKIKMPLAIGDVPGGDGVRLSLLVLHADAETLDLDALPIPTLIRPPAERQEEPKGEPVPDDESATEEESAPEGEAVIEDKPVVERARALDAAEAAPETALSPAAPKRHKPRDEAGKAKKAGGPARDFSEADFLAKVSHEVRTPLNSIIGFAQLMKEERLGPLGNDRYRSYVRDILESGEYALSLINDLLNISKLEAGAFKLNFTSVDINDVIAECAHLMQPQAQKERILLRLSLADDLPMVLADRRSMKQILLNLLSNAIKFTNPGGQIIVDSRRKASGAVRLRVQDNGVGMSESEIEQAMQPFRQLDTAPRKQVGTGLGLPLTRALVKANRAKFKLASAPRSGTKVTVTFPAERTVER